MECPGHSFLKIGDFLQVKIIPFAMRTDSKRKIQAIVFVIACIIHPHIALAEEGATPVSAAAPKPSLSVTLVKAAQFDFPRLIKAKGDIAAWQEASVGTETSGLRLNKVLVNVGEHVKKGQMLAEFASDTLEAELVESKAKLAEAQANFQIAQDNARRARNIDQSGALSELQIDQYLSSERSAKAKLELAQATLKKQQVLLNHTQIHAPEAGLISSRSATLGAVMPSGQELFRLIIGGRLEWRAEVPAEEFTQLNTGMSTLIKIPGQTDVVGKIRSLAPAINPQTRLGIVYVDFSPTSQIKAGMFAQGVFNLGNSSAITLPAPAIVMRDGFSYIFQITPEQKVVQVKVETGRRQQERIEILTPIKPDAEFVSSGTGFLNDGDLVKVVSGS